MDHRDLTRRDFLRCTVVGAAGLAFGGLIARNAWGADEEAPKSIVALARDADALDAEQKVNVATVESLINQALAAATGTDSSAAAWAMLLKPDDTVGLVPTQALAPTHKEVLDILISQIKAAGIPEDRIKLVQRDKAGAAACTALINVPGLKCHWLTGIGTVLKNYIMFTDASPRDYHDANSANLGAIWNMPTCSGKTRITIVDALRPLFDKGPQVDPRYLWDYKGILASTDPVALETVCLQILMAKRKEFKGEDWPLSPPPLCVKAADETYKLGTSDPAKIDLKRLGWMEGVLV